MISDHDRSGWFGASDVSYIMGNWNTKSFKRWWLTKLGLNDSQFATRAMNAGTYYEGAVLDVVGSPRRNHQIIIPEYKLRVNYDGDGEGRIDEVKTHAASKVFKTTKGYKQQVNVQMYAKLIEEGRLPKANIYAYGLIEDDYKNFFNPIDQERLTEHKVEYCEEFIVGFLERLTCLVDCMEKGVFPQFRGYRLESTNNAYRSCEDSRKRIDIDH